MRIRPSVLVLALVAFALRALIPIGFMPAADGTLSLMICPGGFPPSLLSGAKTAPDGMAMDMDAGMPTPMPTPVPAPHGHPGHGLMEDGFCVFTTGFSSAPPPLILASLYLLLAVIAVIATSLPAPAGTRRLHSPPARAPPLTA